MFWPGEYKLSSAEEYLALKLKFSMKIDEYISL